MNAFSSLTAEWVLRVCEIVAIVAGALAVAAVVGQVFAGRVVGERQASKLLALEGANIEAQRALEAEKVIRLELEKSVARRLIPFVSEGAISNIDSLRPFKGTEMILEIAPDDEAQRAAQNISELLQEAGWKLGKVERPLRLGGFSEGVDGVVVMSYRPVNTDPNAEALPSQKAASALVDFLISNGWVARSSVAGTTGIVFPNTVKISVGVKPMPYFWKQTQRSFTKQRMKPAW